MVRRGFKHSEKTKRKMSLNNGRYWKGKKFSEEHKRKMSEKLLGNNRHLGKKHSKETRLKISKKLKGRTSPRKGQKCLKITKERISKALLGNSNAKGKKLSAETKEKMSKAHMGHKVSRKTRRKQSEVRKGIVYSEKTKKKMSKAKKGISLSIEHREKLSKSHRGEKSYLWKGGISFEPYSINWNEALKRRIRDRDNHICQLCGIIEETLEIKLCVHHVDYNKQNCKENNLISLCQSCNSKVNGNRICWTKHFEGVINERASK